METVNFQPSGEEIDLALMDLGPLLGVTIKEEAPDELAEPAAAPPPTPNNEGSVSEGAVAGASTGGEGVSKREGGETGEGAEGADSLASPGARAAFSAARCVLCSAQLGHTDGTPKLMECLHSTCEPCIKAKIEEKHASSRDFLGAERITVTCPVCRLQCQPANMIDQRFVLEKIAMDQAGAGNNGAASGEQQCNSCEDTEPATSYCVDCGEFICDNCVRAHQRLKITKDHTIKCKEEAIAELQASQPHAHDMFCRDHPQERLSLFCETCDRLTCRDCQLQHHRDHKYQFSTEMAAQARANIASLLSEVSYKRVLLGSAMKVIRERQHLIADKKRALVHDITQTVVKLTNAINTRGKQLVLRLNEVCDSKQRTLSEKKDALEQLAAITDHCVEFVNAALDQGSDTAVLYSKRAVCAHLQRIKSRRADIPNPEIPVRIGLALDKLPDLIKVLSTIGAIVVDGKVDGGSSGNTGAPTSAGPAGATATAGGVVGGAGTGAGGAGGAQGPYHPPAHAAPPHSAVVALQQVAMQQSYVQSRSGGASPVGGAGGVGVVGTVGTVSGAYMSALQQQMRARAHTPLRHPHVTSTTHPHHQLHGMSELNLRGLLNAAGGVGSVRAAVNARPLPTHQHHQQHQQHQAHQAMQHAYHQMMGAYASNAYAGAGGSGRRSGGPRTPSPAPHYPPHAAPQHAPHTPHQPSHQAPPQAPHQPHQPPAKWHIPQHNITNGSYEMGLMGGSNVASVAGGSSAGGLSGNEFKITLGRRSAALPSAPSAVTSTNPKTPSPSLNGVNVGASELDKVCAESVQDLMATIAKLDSNGVQVVPEQPAVGAPLPLPPAPSPHVHSSTDGAHHLATDKGGVGAGGGAGSGDPNEDWCAVCMDGGELMCCDKCPKVFHQYCHIPTIEKLPDETETWQCLLCVNFAELPDEEPAAGGSGLTGRQQKLVERITLELYCQYELSLPFREPVPQDNHHYHTSITQPMCLDMIRMKLQPGAAARYTHLAQFVADCRLLFRNAYHYNEPDSQIYKYAKGLEEFFDAQLVKWLPEYAYWSGEGEPPVKRARVDD